MGSKKVKIAKIKQFTGRINQVTAVNEELTTNQFKQLIHVSAEAEIQVPRGSCSFQSPKLVQNSHARR